MPLVQTPQNNNVSFLPGTGLVIVFIRGNFSTWLNVAAGMPAWIFLCCMPHVVLYVVVVEDEHTSYKLCN